MIGDQCLIIKGKELAEVQMKMAVKRKENLYEFAFNKKQD